MVVGQVVTASRMVWEGVGFHSKYNLYMVEKKSMSPGFTPVSPAVYYHTSVARGWGEPLSHRSTV